MWGYIATEASYNTNFGTGFSTTRSDVLVHLAQWQYWWWFWFAFLWSFYYLVISRTVRYRVMKMRPKISTSFRPRGKWGDFLAGVIPAIWCLNILANSNFILRLIEWQNESSLFTVRIRARQWYWVYKFELKNFTDILSAPKNVGNNKWRVNVFGDLQTADDYLHILQLRSQNKWVKGYWNTVISKTGRIGKHHLVSAQDQVKMDLMSSANNSLYMSRLPSLALYEVSSSTNSRLITFNSFKSSSLQNYLYGGQKRLALGSNQYYWNYLKQKKSNWSVDSLDSELFGSQSEIFSNQETLNDLYQSAIFTKSFKINSDEVKFLYSNVLQNTTQNLNQSLTACGYNDFFDGPRNFKRPQGIRSPLRLIKVPFGLTSSNSDTLQLFSKEGALFRVRFNDGESTLQHKIAPHTNFLVLKQKKYARKRTITPQNRFYYKDTGNSIAKVRYSGKPLLLNNSIFEDNLGDTNVYYNLIKKNKKRSEHIPVTLARRILRTKRTLVLPAQVNITLITNSFDVVHSWFIPGLGVKLDCVPGRSTHHTLFIDNVGFYYGQCAEICGRYHHHMPIRVCALPFEHFLVWWHTFGLPKLLFTPSQKNYEDYYSFRKYIW